MIKPKKYKRIKVKLVKCQNKDPRVISKKCICRVGFVLSEDLSQTKRKEEEGSEKKEIKGMKLTLTPLNVVFGFNENPKS